MKRKYEIALMQHVHGSVEDDYETVHYECEGGYSYMECKKRAKEISKHIGESKIPNVNYTFNGSVSSDDNPQQRLDEGLAAVKIVCYTETEDNSYAVLYYEYYRNGRVDFKESFDNLW